MLELCAFVFYIRRNDLCGDITYIGKAGVDIKLKEDKMAEHYVVVVPFGISPERIYKATSRQDADWLKNQLKQLKHKVKTEKTQGGSF